MEAIILAGGFGTRLRPLTYTRAKALLPILNKPMISYIIDNLPKNVDTVVVAVNYRKDQLETYLKNMGHGKEIIVNNEPEPLGTAGAVKYAERYITGPFFVLNADTVCSLDFAKMIRFHEKKNAEASISLWPVENVSEFGVVDIKKDGNITNFVEKPKQEDAPSNLINAGAYLLQLGVLDYIETGRLISMEKEIFPQIIKDTGRFYGYKFDGYWIDVGRIKSYLDVHQLLMKKQHKSLVTGKQCTIDGKLVHSCIGNNVNLGQHSTVDSSVVFNDVHIGKHTLIENCVLGERCILGDNIHLKNCVVGDNEHVSSNTVLENTVVWTQQAPVGYPQKQIGNVLGE